MKLQELQNLRNIVKQDDQKEAMLFLLEEMIKLRAENNMLNKKIGDVINNYNDRSEDLRLAEIRVNERNSYLSACLLKAEKVKDMSSELIHTYEKKIGNVLSSIAYKYFDLMVQTGQLKITESIIMRIDNFGTIRVYQNRIVLMNLLNKYSYCVGYDEYVINRRGD